MRLIVRLLKRVGIGHLIVVQAMKIGDGMEQPEPVRLESQATPTFVAHQVARYVASSERPLIWVKLGLRQATEDSDMGSTRHRPRPSRMTILRISQVRPRMQCYSTK